jgi:diguanylate cyclase (GGDEF)-like protein
MRCLISLIIISAIFIVALLNIVKVDVSSPVFNIVIIPAAVSVIFFSLYEAILVVSACVLMAVSFLFLGSGIGNVVQTIIFLIAIICAGVALRQITARLMNVKIKVLNVIKEEYRSFYHLDKRSENEKLHLQKTVHDISSLYEAPKKMISSITLEELIDCMKKSIVGYFVFSKCKLIIFAFKEKEPHIDKVYNISEAKDDRDSLSGYEEALCGLMKGKNSPLIVDRLSNMPAPDELKLPDSVETFTAIPLIAGSRFNGVFAIEGVRLDDMVRFLILGHQFAIVLERIRLYALVQELSITDGLTNVFVRRYFLERLNEEMDRAGHFATNLSFLMLDIDHFKRCNDKFGHLVGDVVLKRIADILKSNLREIDIIGRYGGEEFSIMLPETTKEGAFVVGERLREAVKEADINAYDENIKLTISMGIATFPDDTNELNQLIDRADQMLYKAKEAGRNRVKVYENKK